MERKIWDKIFPAQLFLLIFSKRDCTLLFTTPPFSYYCKTQTTTISHHWKSIIFWRKFRDGKRMGVDYCQVDWISCSVKRQADKNTILDFFYPRSPSYQTKWGDVIGSSTRLLLLLLLLATPSSVAVGEKNATLFPTCPPANFRTLLLPLDCWIKVQRHGWLDYDRKVGSIAWKSRMTTPPSLLPPSMLPGNYLLTAAASFVFLNRFFFHSPFPIPVPPL